MARVPLPPFVPVVKQLLGFQDEPPNLPVVNHVTLRRTTKKRMFNDCKPILVSDRSEGVGSWSTTAAVNPGVYLNAL